MLTRLALGLHWLALVLVVGVVGGGRPRAK